MSLLHVSGEMRDHMWLSLVIPDPKTQPMLSLWTSPVGRDWGFPSGSGVKNPPAMQETQETWVQSLGQEGPLEEGMTTHSSILA